MTLNPPLDRTERGAGTAAETAGGAGGHDTQGAAHREQILAAASALVRAYGVGAVSLAQVAEAAGLDEITVRRHWSSAQDLAPVLLAHELAEWLASVRTDLEEDPENLRPSRLVVLLLRRSWRHEFVDLIASDLHMRQVVAAQSPVREALEQAMPQALCMQVMPLLRRGGLVREDLSAREQAYLMHTLMTGFVVAQAASHEGDAWTTDPEAVDPETLLAYAMSQLLEARPEPSREQCERTLTAVIEGIARVEARLGRIIGTVAGGAT